MDNLKYYNSMKTVPEDAKKTIDGGRLNGFTDINPMWRIKALTETFGPVGVGWKTVIKEKRIEQGEGVEKKAFVDIDLYIKTDDGWSEPIPGTGGSTFVESNKNGAYTNDECFKMAYTDALSVACKMLGMGADVYWSNDVKRGTTDLSSHDIMAVQQRVMTLLSAKMKKKGLSMEDVAKLLSAKTKHVKSVKDVNMTLGLYGRLKEFEEAVAAL